MRGTCLVLAVLFCCGCYPDAGSFPHHDAGRGGLLARDLGFEMPDATHVPEDLTDTSPPDPCGDPHQEAGCYAAGYESPFPLHSDPQPDPAVLDQGLVRTAEGFLRLAPMESAGTYRVLISGCRDLNWDEYVDTLWYAVNWDAEVPLGTTLRVRAQSSDSTKVDDEAAWQQAMWTQAVAETPLYLQGNLMPNLDPSNDHDVVHDKRLRVEFELRSDVPGRSPQVKHFTVGFKCPFVDLERATPATR